MRYRKNPAKEPTQTTAILDTSHSEGASLVLFDMEQVSQLAQRGMPLEAPAVLGYISAHEPELGTPPGQTFDPSACGGAWQVGTAVSVKGWGPLLYDSLLGWVAEHPARASGIMPSWSIRPSAKEVWSYYANWRPDVDTYPLPQSCVRHPDEPYLDQVYRASDASLFRELDRRGRQFVAAEGTGLRDELHEAGVRMFARFLDAEITRRMAR